MTKYHCPTCNSSDLLCLVDRKDVPVHQNLLLGSAEEARSISRGHLHMLSCQECGFVFNRAFDPGNLSYGAQYDNNQACSAVFQDHLDNLIDYLLNQQNVNNCRIVEVGCGQGKFIKRLVDEGIGNVGIGYDPSYSGDLVEMNGRLSFKKRFYDNSCAEQNTEIVICRHVIEHIKNPLELLRSIRSALGPSPEARVYFETPCVEWILENHVIWDFFYEHCSLFTASSLTLAFEKTGFIVNDVRHIFRGQYLWIDATVGQLNCSMYSKAEKAKYAIEYISDERIIIDQWEERISELLKKGAVALWGAGAKGVTFANLIDPARTQLDCIVDVNPNKQGKYVAGSAHPIVSYNELKKRGVHTVILMNPNYRCEILALLKNAGMTDIELVD